VRHEFATHNTEDTLATMVEDAYVNHIPVLTGGVGKDELREFYSKRFHSPDAARYGNDSPFREPSANDQLVDEMVFKFTHTIPMDWMLPVSLLPESELKCPCSHRSIQGRQAGSRAYLLGPGFRAGPTRITRCLCPARCRR